MPHIHDDAISAAILLAYLIILGALWRTAAGYLTSRGSVYGEAMAYVF
jgi:hypothetical protein